ncbi:DNA-directed RNA polymerase sigma-70 factor [Undibacterium sp. YM2]|uniref:RNA polymerase sigma factor n=1 Tax=Undibacterium sp. YM2 TaxID=2058625 RepID=UPI001331C72C|nr:RNA polymerase sigma factor [Undibacterium sp. YM2]BBB67739.1 DNA-directed RNA polymerase sigma-70 factor [Undibacterium sp. YM2]
MNPISDHIRQTLDRIYQQESRRVFATLVHLLGDFDLAEEALHEAFKAALEQWPDKGLPEYPHTWLVSAGRYKAIDSIRRQRRFDPLDEHVEAVEALVDETAQPGETAFESSVMEDDRLRLIFTCCHPALAADAQVALTLREVCGLTTEEIAHAFLTPAPTLAQRIVRAKAKIRDARIPYQVPEKEELAARLHSVLRVIYLVFNEGYSSSAGDTVLRLDLAAEAIRLTRLLQELLPEPEVNGLLALMLLHESRRPARTDSQGELIALEQQDRQLWDQELIDEGCTLVEQALRSGRFGAYTLQAAISAVHAEAATYAETDWPQIVGLYDALLRVEASPIIELNRAIAIAMCTGGLKHGLSLVEALLEKQEMQNYHLAHAARADLCRRNGDMTQACLSYELALKLCKQEPEKRFIERRLLALKN